MLKRLTSCDDVCELLAEIQWRHGPHDTEGVVCSGVTDWIITATDSDLTTFVDCCKTVDDRLDDEDRYMGLIIFLRTWCRTHPDSFELHFIPFLLGMNRQTSLIDSLFAYVFDTFTEDYENKTRVLPRLEEFVQSLSGRDFDYAQRGIATLKERMSE